MIAATTRLHISPLSPDLLRVILGAEASKAATNISFHSLQTFPETGYGYVDLPKMEADKVKKKINGAILKGKKVKVEEARPKKRKHAEDDEEDMQHSEDNDQPHVRARKNSRKDSKLMQGHELSPERKVKRGWTENKSEKSKKKKVKSQSNTKSQPASKYSEKDELLFRTKVPTNKDSQLDKGVKRKRKAQGGTEIVHEFEKSVTVPSFLRSEVSGAKKAVAYVDGEGWVDDEGVMVQKEAVKASRRRNAAQHSIGGEVINTQDKKTDQHHESVAKISARGSSGSSLVSEEEQDGKSQHDTQQLEPLSTQDAHIDSDSDSDETSSSGTSESDATSEAFSEPAGDTELNTLAIPANEIPPKAAVHPLEALFKKPTKPASSQATSNSQDVVKPSLEVQTTFSFFEHQDDDDSLPPMPMTPFSSQDLRSRGIRSAAPTPDTAHPSRMGSIFNGEESDGDLSELGDNDRPDGGSESLQVPQTDFEKQFWEKRGENNRAWKARRRAVLKEKRQRENRARRPKNW